MKKVVVFGSREFNNYSLVEKYLNALVKMYKNIEIVSGHARGADSLGEAYATSHGLNLHLYPAEWDKYGKSAGYVRNKRMAEVSDIGIGFWDGKSKGTKHMMDLLVKENKLCYYILYTDNPSVINMYKKS